MTVTDSACGKTAEVKILNPESKNYDRDYKFALLVFRGAMPWSAAQKCKMRPNHGHLLLSRWRKKAVEKAGCEVSDALILRTIVAPETAQDDWQTILTAHCQKVAKSGQDAEK